MLTKTTLAQSTPEAQGIASESILAFIDGVERARLALHGMVLVRHGQVVAKGWWSPFAADLPHMLFSLSKSFTSTAVGMAVAEGLLSVEDRVVDFFPDDLPDQIDENLAVMTVYNLLIMNTGHDKDTTEHIWQEPDGNWAKGFLARPVEHKPGSKFVYNSGATYMCSAIMQKVTGQTLLDYLTPRLFEPLGIEGATWESDPRGINVGGWGLKIKTEDIANFGQLYLQEGRWQGQQLIAPEWVAAATSKQTRNDPSPNPDWAQGYGYQFWRCQHNAYRGDGAFGQYCIVMPDQDAVLAINSGVRNMQAVLNLVWEHLLPAMQDEPLPANSSAQKALSERLATLAMPPQSGAPSSYTASLVSGKRYHFEENKEEIKELQLDFHDEGATLTIVDDRDEHRIPIGYQAWALGKTLYSQPLYVTKPVSTAASGAWTAEDTYTVLLNFNESPFMPTITFRFSGDTLLCRGSDNVGFAAPEDLEHSPILGKRV